MMGTFVISLIALLLVNIRVTGQTRISHEQDFWSIQNNRLLLSPGKPERTFLGKPG